MGIPGYHLPNNLPERVVIIYYSYFLWIILAILSQTWISLKIRMIPPTWSIWGLGSCVPRFNKNIIYTSTDSFQFAICAPSHFQSQCSSRTEPRNLLAFQGFRIQSMQKPSDETNKQITTGLYTRLIYSKIPMVCNIWLDACSKKMYIYHVRSYQNYTIHSAYPLIISFTSYNHV